MIKARFLPAAEAEFMAEFAYYSGISPSLGRKFVIAVEAAVKMAANLPASGVPAIAGTRRWLLKGFPFSIVCRASVSELLIVALAHHRRKPGYWRGRVRSN